MKRILKLDATPKQKPRGLSSDIMKAWVEVHYDKRAKEYTVTAWSQGVVGSEDEGDSATFTNKPKAIRTAKAWAKEGREEPYPS